MVGLLNSKAAAAGQGSVLEVTLHFDARPGWTPDFTPAKLEAVA
jgi:hypothetical protein